MTAVMADASPSAILAGDVCVTRLDMKVDIERLRQELRAVEAAGDWRHQRPYSAGVVGAPISAGWTCFPFRSPGGLIERTDPGGPGRLGFAETPALAGLPAFRRLLRTFPCELRSARLLALAPGTHVEEHRDEFVGFEYGQLRLHVPIVTNPGAVLVMEGRHHRWGPGELWYGNFTLLHSVYNEGRIRRIHLVIDCMLNKALLHLFPKWFQERVRRLTLVTNRPSCVPMSSPRVREFQLPQVMSADLLAHIPDEGICHQPGASASVEQEDGDLVLRTAEGVTCTLVPVGPHEYRFQGWTEERTLSFDALPHFVLLHDRRRFGRRTWVCPSRPEADR